MAKMVMTEAKNDGFLLATGKQKMVVETADGPRLRYNDFSQFHVEFRERTTNGSGVFTVETQKIKLRPTNSDASIRQLVENNLQFGVNYSDHYSELTFPVHLSQVETINLNKTVSSYDVFTRFNYLSNEYDSFTEVLEEADISSVYSAAPISKQDFVNSRRVFPMGNETRAPNTNLGRVPSNTVKVVVPQGGASAIALDRFPFYNQIQINNKVQSDFSSFLKTVGLSELFLASYAQSPKTLLNFNFQDEGVVYAPGSTEVLDLSSWVISGDLNISLDEFFVTDLESLSVLGDMAMNLRKSLFAGFLKRYANDYFRTFKEIYDKNPCYFEDYAYSIDKFNNSTGGGAAAQTFYAQADPGGTTLLDDTQIKYGNTYFYKCKTHYIIVGNQYSYTTVSYHSEVAGSEPDYALVTIQNKPQIIIIPIDTFSEQIVTIQPPSIFPQVKFITQNNSKNTVDIYLSPTKGQLRDRFVPIMPEDDNQLALMMLNSRRKTGVFRFNTMREDGLFEIFKMKTAPKSLKDFANFKLTEIRMSYESQDAIFKDKVLPNTEYYYIFRKINSKDLVSNPTAIYKVELLVDADDSKVVVEEYTIPELPTSKASRKFQSLFQIVPAMDQVYFENDQSSLFGKSTFAGSLNELSLGVADESIWGRTFKFRIKSTTSGKIIDYNVTFTLTKDKTEEDF